MKKRLLTLMFVASALFSAGMANAQELVSKNAYAYDIAVATNDTEVTVTYQLNAIATAVTVQACSGDMVVGEYDGTADAGINTVTIPVSDLPKDTEITIKVKVVSEVVDTPTVASISGMDETYYEFWSPYGIAVDNNPESATFGRILVTETRTTAYDQTKYHSSQAKGGIGVGIYAFDPQMQPIANSEGGYGFTAGMTRAEGSYSNGSGAIFDFKRVHYSADGRLFLARTTTTDSGLWELDPNDLESDATPVFTGTIDEETGYITDEDDNFVSGPATAMDVWGSGDNLKVAIISCKDGYKDSDGSNIRVDIYDLGSAKEWSEAPSQELSSISGAYWTNTAAINALFDGDGKGLLVGQTSGSLTDADPSYKHVNLETGEVDYTDISAVANGAGMAWNCDNSLLARTNGGGQIGIYKVSTDADGAPVYELQYSLATGLGNNMNAVAWDIAGNLYVCSNSGEKFSTYAMPRESGEVVVPAASKYAFTLSSNLVSKNAYAYDVAVSTDDTEATVTYRLNAKATAVEVQACSGDDVVATYSGTNNDDINTVVIPISDLPEDTEITIKVKVVSEVVDAPAVAAISGMDETYYDFYSPYGIAVDNNPESDNFGRILVTESRTAANSQTKYHSSPAKGGVGVGIYAFDPQMQPIANSEGGYGFTAGITRAEGDYPAATGEAIYDFKRLHYSDDGRLFLSRATITDSGLWELDPDNLESGAEPVFTGTIDEETGYITDEDGNFVSGPAPGMDVWGSGDDLKVAIVSCEKGYVLSGSSHRVDIYNLGSAKEWSEAPSQELSSISGAYWVASYSLNALFDVDGGGLLVGQYRSSPSQSSPSYKHVNLETGNVDYSDETTVAGGAGMAWNCDKSLLAMANAAGGVGIYKVTADADGAPVYELQYSLATGLGNNTNAVAWDIAGNLYACSNNGEKFSTYVMPRESGEVTVPAAAKYAFTTPGSNLVSKNAYAYDIAVSTDDTEATVTYRLNAKATAVEVQACSGDDVVATYSGTNNDGINTVVIPISDLPEDTEINIKITVTSEVVDEPTVAAISGMDETYYEFWSPYGIIVDNNPESDNFGRILVTESTTAANSQTKYHSSPANGGIGVGIYAFDPQMQPISNSEGGHGFTGGITRAEGDYPAGDGGAIYDFKRLHYSDDGRLFLSRVTVTDSGLWELDPDDLESGAEPVFTGTIDETTGYITDDNGNFVSGPATGMDVWGEGDDLKVAIASCQYGYSTAASSHRVDVYNLGSAKEWSEAPSQSLTNLNGYWVNSNGINTLFDVDGAGLLVGQYRSSPSETRPSYVHTNLETGEIDYMDITTQAGGSGMAWNYDKSLLARSSGVGMVGIYKVTADADGAPAYELQYEFATGLGTNTNAVAWDVAGNLYACSNNGEMFSTYVMPRESGEVTVPAAAKYAFTTPGGSSNLVSKNAYAYDIAVSTDDTEATVTYRLNAKATAVEVQACSGDDVVATYSGTKDDDINTVVIPISDLPEDTEINIKIKVTSEVVDEPTVAAISGMDETYYEFWSPYGIAVDNNPESGNFGRILVTETQSNAIEKEKYHSSPAKGGIGAGIYAFDPQMQAIANSEGGHGFTAGITPAEGNYPAGEGGAIYDFKRLHYSDDGRLFLSRATVTDSGLWELDPDDLESGAEPVFTGTIDETTGYITDDNGNFVSGPATAMDVWGEGDDLKVAIVSCEDGYVLAGSSHRVDIYNLGSAKEWSEAPSQNLSSITGYWINSAIINTLFDVDGGGLLVGQYRSAPSPSEPSYKHVNLETGKVDYTDETTVAGGAGMAWNYDKSLLAMANAAGGVGIYKVTADADGAPVYELQYSLATGLGTNTNAIAWDVAGNLYACSNSGEKFSTYAMPRESGDVIVPAASKYIFSTSGTSGVEVVEEVAASATVSVIPGAILISGEYDNAMIYNTTGILVVAKALPENRVSAGIYLVVVDGKTTKVLVR